MSDTMGAVKTGLGVVWKVVQFGMFCWALVEVFPVRNLWMETMPESADVLTVQAKGFWGPVHAVVPRHCKHFERNDAASEDRKEEKGGHEREESRRLAPPGALRGPAPAEGAEVQPPFEKEAERAVPLRGAGAAASWPQLLTSDGRVGSPVGTMAEEVAGRRLRESDGSEDVTYNATHITVRRCGRTLHFEQPTAGQRYWAMLFLSGWDTMEELRASRWRMLWLFVVAGFVENLVNCLAEVMKVVAPPSPQMQGYANVDMKEAMKQLPAPLRAVCGLFTDSLQKFASLQNQLAIMSLFFVYWHNHAYVVSFIPGKAYIFIFGSYFLVFAFGCVQACGERAMGVFGCLACCWFLFLIPCVIFPMLFGYGWYSANFLWNTALADAVSEEMTYGMIDIKTAGDYLEREKVLEAEWAGDMECVRSAAEWLFGAHALEVVTNFVLTLAESFIS